MFSAALPAERGDLLVCRHISHVVQFTLLTLIHGLVGLLVPPAETKAFPEPGWKSGLKDGGEKRDRKKLINLKYTQKNVSVCVSIRVSKFLTQLYAHINLQLCYSIYGCFSVLANTSTAQCPIPHTVLCGSVL